MKAARFVRVVGALLMVAAVAQVAPASGEFWISCEGIESTGGGMYKYQYTLKNTGIDQDTLTDLYVSTEDPNVSRYTFFLPATGWTAAIVPNNAPPPTSIMFTFSKKTPHGVVPTGVEVQAAALIHWSGSAIIPAGDSITFAYTHPYESWDHEWHAVTEDGVTTSESSSPIAGPTGIYTDGYVHSPGYPVPVPSLTTWGMIALLALIVLAGMWMLIRSRRRAATMA
ncbi:hypothetical protein ACFLQW_01885 [Candidatus Zixiibacteriota bacterium]